MLFNENDVYRVSLPTIEAVNPVGSGDAMIGGMAVAISRACDYETIIKEGVACGTANAMESETGRVDQDNVLEIMKKLNVQRLK